MYIFVESFLFKNRSLFGFFFMNFSFFKILFIVFFFLVCLFINYCKKLWVVRFFFFKAVFVILWIEEVINCLCESVSLKIFVGDE